MVEAYWMPQSLIRFVTQVHEAGKAAVKAGVWASHIQRPPHFKAYLHAQPWWEPSQFWYSTRSPAYSGRHHMNRFVQFLEGHFVEVLDEFKRNGTVYVTNKQHKCVDK